MSWNHGYALYEYQIHKINTSAITELASGAVKSSHRAPTQAANLVVCLKHKEMYGKILKSLIIVNLYRGMSNLKLKMNVNLC